MMNDEQRRRMAEHILQLEEEEALKAAHKSMFDAALQAKQRLAQQQEKQTVLMAKENKKPTWRFAWQTGVALAAACAVVVGGSLLYQGANRLPFQSIALSTLPQDAIVVRADGEQPMSDEQQLAAFGWNSQSELAGFKQVSLNVYPATSVASEQAALLIQGEYMRDDGASVTLTLSQGKLLLLEALQAGNAKQVAGCNVYWNTDPETGERCAAWQSGELQASLRATGVTDGELATLVENVIRATAR